ncbi:MAG: hypothetical protein OEV06_04150, partial [Anaerolineae bacterium]|nr:hypothetical protein [Anaerolineae bacterium]
IKHLHQTILKLCFLMLIILASAMPGVAYIGFYYGGLTRTLIILIGLALPTLMLISSYFFPTYFLNQLLLRASDYKVLQLKKHIKIYEKELLKKTKRINQILTKKNSKEVIRIDLLVEISNYYKGRIKEEKTHRGGPYASSSIIKLFGASLIPVLTFFLQELIRIYLF